MLLGIEGDVMDKVEELIQEINEVPTFNELNKEIAIALCEIEGIDPYKEVYYSGGISVPAWEYAVRDADTVRKVAIKMGWIKDEQV